MILSIESVRDRHERRGTHHLNFMLLWFRLGQREKISGRFRIQEEDEAIRHKYATLEMRQKMSEISTTASSNPELKAKRVKAIKQAWTLEKRAAMSETMKRVYSVNPEARERLKLAADKGRKSRWG